MLGRTHATSGCAAVTVARSQEAACSNRRESLPSVPVTSHSGARKRVLAKLRVHHDLLLVANIVEDHLIMRVFFLLLAAVRAPRV